MGCNYDHICTCYSSVVLEEPQAKTEWYSDRNVVHVLNIELYITAVSLLSLSVSHQRSPSPPLPPPGTPSGGPTPTGDPNSIQLQPNPSYCLLEMSHQQLMNSQLEEEAKYVNL